MSLQLRQLHSLEKVFADEPLRAKPFTRGQCLRGETFSFQIAYTSTKDWNPAARIRVSSPLKKQITLREVALVPVDYPGENFDNAVLRKTPGLYPDALMPITTTQRIIYNQWRSIWITVRIPKKQKPGIYTIETNWEQNGHTTHTTFQLEVLKGELPKTQLDHTEWFHTDCICSYYDVEPWSKEHWDLLSAYFKNCADHGQNTVLTPIFTPPLDTAVGGERPTVQLVDISFTSGRYRFGFSKLKKWITLAKKTGVAKFEMAHLFTQWGAAYAPKIIVNGKKKFGWHVEAHGKQYRTFLSQFLPALTKFLIKEKLQKKTFFHISDEPNEKHLESYTKAVEFVRPYLEGFQIIDALSSIEFYKRGLVQHPVPANNHIEPFVKAKVNDLWTYYCTSQWNKVSNRFMHMPSSRNRIMGFLLYKYNIKGFLHWGYNFWHTQYSLKSIDPFKVTDAGKAFQSGDAFLVYPGEEGPIDSIRHEVFFEAQQDLRACQALEEKIGRQKVIDLLERGLKYPLTMKSYPHDAEWILKKRQQINLRLS